MEPDQRYLTDLLVLELEPGLAPLMQTIGFEKTSPAELCTTDSFCFHARDQRLVPQHREDFRDPNDTLIYQNSGGLLLQIRKAAWNPYAGTTFWTSIFALAFRKDLRLYPEILHEEAVRIIPPQEQFGKLSLFFREALQEGYVRVGLASKERCGNGQMFLNDEFTKLSDRRFARDFPGMPPDLTPHQLFFNLWLEYGQSVLPPEGQAKAEATRKIPYIVATLANVIQIYTKGQLDAYLSQRRSNAMLDERLAFAAVMPAKSP